MVNYSHAFRFSCFHVFRIDCCYYYYYCRLKSLVVYSLKFRLFAVIDRETLHEQRSKSGSSSPSERVEDQKSLKASTLVGEFADSIQHKIDDLFSNRVMTTCIVVRGILLTRNQLFRMEQLAVRASADLICKTNATTKASSKTIR